MSDNQNQINCSGSSNDITYKDLSSSQILLVSASPEKWHKKGNLEREEHLPLKSIMVLDSYLRGKNNSILVLTEE